MRQSYENLLFWVRAKCRKLDKWLLSLLRRLP